MRRLASITVGLAVANAAFGGDVSLLGSIGSPQGAPYDVFASDVALADASTLVVGIRGADTVAPAAGSIEVFTTTSEGWERVARPSFAGLAAGDQLGEAVAARGDWFAAGAPRHDARGTDAGAVMLARRSGAVWSHVATLLPPVGAGSSYGAALAMTSDRLAIGAPRASGGGFVDVYRRSGDVWSLEARIANPTPSPANRFGESVALGSDAAGVPLLVVGDPSDDAVETDAGSVRIYRLESELWIERAVLESETTSDRQFFGQSVAVADGVVAVGAYATPAGPVKSPIDDAGAVEIFVQPAPSDLQWARVATLVPDEPVSGGSFGWDVALESHSADGDVRWTLVVGEPGASSDAGAEQAGRVHCLEASGRANWSTIVRARMAPTSSQAVFGAAVALMDGMAVFAAPGAAVLGVPQGLAASLDLAADCDENGVPDAIEIAEGAVDADGDGTLDVCQEFAVPGAFPTIQAAIDAVPDGLAATVLVAAGVYSESFELRGKNVVVRGSPELATVLDGTGLAISIARFSGGEPPTAGLERLVFRHGRAGTPVEPPAVAFRGGGAVFGRSTSAFIRGCVFELNAADFGGAIYLADSTIDVSDSVFRLNVARDDGGAMYLDHATGMVSACDFAANRCGIAADGSGGALKATGALRSGEILALQGCTITGSTSGFDGAAIEYRESASDRPGVLRLAGCVVTGNSSGSLEHDGAGGLRIIGAQAACILAAATEICGNLPRNVEGGYLVEGVVDVCDCEGDLFRDGMITATDLAILLGLWGTSPPGGEADLNHDGVVNALDLAALLNAWGPCVD